jgi:hypothetical protein
MKARAIRQAQVWGGLLILSGIIMVLGRIANLSLWVWVAIFGGGGLGALLIYLSDPSDMGLLIPPYVLWAIAGLWALLKLEVLSNGFEATYVLGLAALPFVVAGLRWPRYRWLMIVAFALTVLAVMIPLVEAGILTGELIAAYFVGACALPFVAAWFADRARTWTLWAAYAFGALAILFALTEGGHVAGRYVGTYVLAAAALPLLIHALVQLRWSWRVCVGYGLLAIAVLSVLVEEGIIAERYGAAYILLATAPGCLLAYLRKRDEWWPLVPAAITAVAGTTLLFGQDLATYLGAAVLVLAGLGVILGHVMWRDPAGV